MPWFMLVFVVLPVVAAAQTAQVSKNPAPPATSKEAEHRTEDVARHRQIARAHEEAARCLESGKPEKACQERLREMCKGIAIGQYCGMRHGH